MPDVFAQFSCCSFFTMIKRCPVVGVASFESCFCKAYVILLAVMSFHCGLIDHGWMVAVLRQRAVCSGSAVAQPNSAAADSDFYSNFYSNFYCLISEPESFKAFNDLKYLATKPKL